MQLRLAGLSWTELARRNDCTPQAILQAASGRPSARLEQAIADAIDVPVRLLFPEHWTADGARIPFEQPSSRRSKTTAAAPGVDVQKREVA